MRILTAAALCFFLLSSAVIIGQQPQEKTCEKIDCAHWPWPQECCGVSEGTVVSSQESEFVLKKEKAQPQKFRLSPQTKVSGALKQGEKARVYYRRSVTGNLSTRVIVCADRGTYVNRGGQTVPRPENCSVPPEGATALCHDGTYSFSQSRSGTCSHHGGVVKWF